jgi:hypothetical protein
MSIEQALAACIDAIEQGVSLDECVAAYPQYAGEIRPILQAYLQAYNANLPPMSDAAFERGRRRVLQAASAAQRARLTPISHRPSHARRRARARGAGNLSPTTPSPRQRQFSHTPAPVRPPAEPFDEDWHNLPSVSGVVRHPGAMPQPHADARPARRFSFFTVASTISAGLAACLILGAVWFSQIVDASLPGSPLYTLKRSSEQVQGALSHLGDHPAHWQALQAQRRLEELAALEAQNRPIDGQWLLEIQEQTAAALEAGRDLPAEARISFLDAWLTNLHMLEEQSRRHVTTMPATLAVVQQAIVDTEMLLVEEDMVVLAATPTPIESRPDASPALLPDDVADAPAAGEIAASPANAGGLTPPDAAEPAPPEQIALADTPQTPATETEEPAQAGAETSPEVEDPQIPAAPGADTPDVRPPFSRPATTAPSISTSTPTPLTLPAGQPQATPSPTWTLEPPPGDATPSQPEADAIALAQQPRGTAQPETLGALEDSGEENELHPDRDPVGVSITDTITEDISGEITGSNAISGPLALAPDSDTQITATATITPTQTITPTTTETVTGTPTLVPTYTPSSTPTLSPTSTPVATATPDNDDHMDEPATPAPPEESPTPETATPLPTSLPTETATALPTTEPTATPAPTATPEPEPTTSSDSANRNGHNDARDAN